MMGSRSTSRISERWTLICSFEIIPAVRGRYHFITGDTMLFPIHALEFTGALPTRLANDDAHKAFLSGTARLASRL